MSTLGNIDIPSVPPSQEAKSEQIHEERPPNSNLMPEVIRDALDIARKNSLKNLSSVVDLPKSLGERVCQGRFADIYSSSVKVKGRAVAIKLFRPTVEGSELNTSWIFAKELYVTSGLRHPNVWRPLGYVCGENSLYSIVSEQMNRGTLRMCMADFKFSNHMEELFDVSLGIAKGLYHIHENNIAHGLVRSANILVSPSGEALLANFESSTVKEPSWINNLNKTEDYRHFTRWLPIEYYQVEESEIFRPNQKSDVWAFGMTILELLTGRVPYAYMVNDGAVMKAILKRYLPVEEKPNYIGNDAELKSDIWLLCRKCWKRNPKKRPSMRDILQELIRMKYRHGVGLTVSSVRRISGAELSSTQ
ncbi:kinase-like protein [Schizopora paradoxa]|uniref:Kinase-like protein n=1 Tax=Schizopora paradoxa TaxID=27342 RepID=A0A0H2R5E3_9AGAM|nr:kinase-like protein [Schizopora paradoxa]